MRALIEHGIAYNDDINGARQLGVSFTQNFVSNGQRADVASAFLSPLLRQPRGGGGEDTTAASAAFGLTVLTHAHVTRVLFNADSEAVGVEFLRDVSFFFLFPRICSYVMLVFFFFFFQGFVPT